MPTIMEEFDLLEISAVDRPAQAHAKATIIKAASPKGKPMDLGLDEEDDEESGDMKAPKKGKGKGKDKTKKSDEYGERVATVLTSGEDGHSHLLRLSPGQAGGSLDYSTSDASGVKGGSHDHPWAFNADGEIEIGLADGHMHIVSMEDVDRALLRMLKSDSDDSAVETSDEPAAAAASQEGDMPETKKGEELAQLQAQNDELTKRAERADAVLALKADERAHFDGLDEAGQDEFLGKSEGERGEILKAAGDADPVVYKSIDGSEFRQSDDPRVIKAVQRADEAVKAAGEEREKRETLELAKRADELIPNLPGTPEVRGQLLKAVEGIGDENVRQGALEALKAANGGIFERSSETPEEAGLEKGEGYRAPAGTAEAELERLVKSYQKEHSVPEYKAWDEVLKSEEGATLYRKFTEGTPLAN